MPGPKSEPAEVIRDENNNIVKVRSMSKTRINRNKKRHSLRGDDGFHKRGSQNRNKKYRVISRGGE